MNTTHHKRGPQNRHPHMKRLLTALFVAAMVLILAVPAFAAEAAADESAPDTEVSTSTPDLTDPPADETDPTPAPTCVSARNIDELQDAIAHANANDVIEITDEILIFPETVLGRADCPVTIRRATDDAYLRFGLPYGGNITVQNITFDGAEVQSPRTFVYVVNPTQTFEKCNFVNCVSENAHAVQVSSDDVIFSDCLFANNRGGMWVHLWLAGGNTVATIENCTFINGYSNDRGSIYSSSPVEILMTGCTITGNVAETRGGGIFLANGSLSAFCP